MSVVVNSTTSELESVKLPAELKRRVLTATQLLQPNTRLGAEGEQLARRFLSQTGLVCLATNVVFFRWEVDLIMWDASSQEVVFVEVKTRQSGRFAPAAMAVSRHKLSKMTRIADIFLEKIQWDGAYRFDVVTVLPGKIDHLVGVGW